MKRENKKATYWNTIGTFMSGRACSDTILNVLNRSFSEPMELEENSLVTMAGGLMQHGLQCGMIWGASLAAGRRMYQIYGDTPESHGRSILLSGRLLEAFKKRNAHSNCYDITHLNQHSSTKDMVKFFLLKGGSIGCFKMAGGFGPLAWEEIIKYEMQEPPLPKRGPVSCSAFCAKRMNATDEQTVMASGLAGGIGLSGGGCGALGTAIWMVGMKKIKEGNKKIDYFKFSEAKEMIARFLEVTGGSFECDRITGRVFNDIADHSRFIQEGGCEKILGVLTEYKRNSA